MKKTRFFITVLSVLLLCSCITPSTKSLYVDRDKVRQEKELQQELALRQYLKYQNKLKSAAWPVMKAAVSVCDRKFYKKQTGLSVSNIYGFSKEFRPAAKRAMAMTGKLQVVGVVKDSPVDKAGLRVGDEVLSVNGYNISSGKKADESFNRNLNDVLRNSDDIDLKINRDGEEKLISIKAETLCYFPVNLFMSDAINAFADGEKIGVTKGMLRFVDTDIELSLVLAHEMAHNMMEHLKAKKNNYWLGAIVDFAAATKGIDSQGMFSNMGANMYSQEFETEADYVALYVLALAGFDISEAANFWRRMAVEHPSNISGSYSSSHPSTPERFVAIEGTVEEIKLKQRLGFPLEPAIN